MEPKHKSVVPPESANDLDDFAESEIRPARRRRLDPRVEEIIAAARAGRISDQDALSQIEAVMSELLGKMLPPAEREGVETVLRQLKSDPVVLGWLRDEK